MRMRRSDWHALLAQLNARGRGETESGAFLLASRNGDRRLVVRAVFYDDLDPHCLQGGIHFNGLAYGDLWALCRAEQLTVIGDVHTHPGPWVGQSTIDAGSPMVAQSGHVAVIVPYLAQRSAKLKHVGVHLYGNDGWTTWTGREAARRLFVRRFV